MKKTLTQKSLILCLLLLITQLAKAQFQVNGTVTDSDKEILPGVSVIVKGAGTGVTTDSDGKFSLSVPSGKSTLVFSFVGFKSREVMLNDQKFLNVILESGITELEDVVVVGYGTKKRAELTTSVVQVKGAEIKESPSVNYASSLAGRLPGLFVNQRTSDPGQEQLDIAIRGLGTFGNNTVLVVVDGVIGRDGLSRLDPQDVESISVLKDASASVYGARAANGVILITTKRGASGKPVITLNSNVAVSNPTTTTQGITPYNYARQVNAIRARNGQSQLYSNDDLLRFKSGSFNGIDFWNELFKHTSFEQRHNLSVRGGTEKLSYFTSLGTAQQNPLLNQDKVTGFSQYNVRSNIDFNPTKRIQVGLDLAGRLEKVNAPPYLFQTVDKASKVIPINERYESDGKYLRLINGQENPFAYLQKQAGKISKNNTLFNGTLRLQYDFPFLEGLSFKSWGALDYGQNYINTFSNNPLQYILGTDGKLTENRLSQDISVQDEYYRQSSLTYHTRFEYQKNFNRNNLEAFVAYEQNKIKYNGNTLSRRAGLISEDLPYLSQGDPNTQNTSSTIGQSARQAYIGRISYDFDKRYLASFGFRYDGSYVFPKSKRFGFFPYASAGWVISKESFLKENNTLNFLKIRATYGTVGNDLVDPFQYLQRFQNPSQSTGVFVLSLDGNNSNAIPLAGTNQLILSPVGVDPNPYITWESSKKTDLGIETRLFNNHINFDLTLFNERRENILAQRNVTIPAYTGLNPPKENIGKTKNQGFEAILGYNHRIGKVDFDVTGNVAYAKSELVFNDAATPEESYQSLYGYPVGSRLVYHAVGIYKSEADLKKYPSRTGTGIGDLIYADTNGDGKITTADRIVMAKSSVPRTQYGITLHAAYNNFDLSAFMQGQTGSVLQLASFLDEGTSSANYFGENAWTPDTPNSSLPSIGGTKSILNGYTSYDNDYFTYNTNYIRLKNLQLGYHIPKNLTKNWGIASMSFYLSGYNMLTFSKFNKLNFADVEQTNGLGYQAPLRKLYSLRVELSF